MRCAVWNEWIFSSNTPEDKTCGDRDIMLEEQFVKVVCECVIPALTKVNLLFAPKPKLRGISGIVAPCLLSLLSACSNIPKGC